MSSITSLLSKGHPSQVLTFLHVNHLTDTHSLSTRIDAGVSCIFLHQFQRVLSDYINPTILENLHRKNFIAEDDARMAELIMAFCKLHVDLDADAAWTRVGSVEMTEWILHQKA